MILNPKIMSWCGIDMVANLINQAISGFKTAETLCNKHLQTGCKNILNQYN